MSTDRKSAGRAWEKIGSRIIHETPWLELREDVVRLPDGRTTTYGVVDCGDCVGVLPFIDPEHVVLIRQYRYIAGRFTWEMPTGGVDEGERLEAAAQRELAEETGYRARVLSHVSTYHTSKSSMNETAHLYVGRDLVPHEASPDETEQIETRVFPFSEVVSMVLDGEITDSMTVIAVLRAMGVPRP